MIYDLLVSGAGPAGLSSAIYSARMGKSVLVLEKKSETGVFPRGETMRPDTVQEELLGKEFMESISINRTAKRRYWSPGARKKFELEREAESYIFHWKDLTNGLKESAEKAGAEIRFNSEVVSPVTDKGHCTGFLLKDGTVVSGKTMVAADGHRSCLTADVDRNRINCPIAKRLCSGVAVDYDGMEFFFIAQGQVDPDFPAAIAFIFPRGNSEAEVGVSIIAGGLSKKQRERLPSPGKMLDFLQKLFDDYPVFSERVKQATWSFQGVTQIPMGGLHNAGMEIPGLILAGDTIGMVEASGGCGIVPSMKNGRFIAGFLEKHNPEIWNTETMQLYNREFASSEIRRQIAGKYRKIIPLMRLGFSRPFKDSTYAGLWRIVDRLYRLI